MNPDLLSAPALAGNPLWLADADVTADVLGEAPETVSWRDTDTPFERGLTVI